MCYLFPRHNNTPKTPYYFNEYLKTPNLPKLVLTVNLWPSFLPSSAVSGKTRVFWLWTNSCFLAGELPILQTSLYASFTWHCLICILFSLWCLFSFTLLISCTKQEHKTNLVLLKLLLLSSCWIRYFLYELQVHLWQLIKNNLLWAVKAPTNQICQFIINKCHRNIVEIDMTWTRIPALCVCVCVCVLVKLACASSEEHLSRGCGV